MTPARQRPLNGPARARAQGFTLAELMVVVVIVAILAAVAVPTYQNQVTKARRSDAKTALLDAAQRQEQFILDQNTYATDMTLLGYGASPATSEEGYYTISASNAPCGDIQRCYTLTATRVATEAQGGDTECGNFVLNSSGARTVTGSLPATDCW